MAEDTFESPEWLYDSDDDSDDDEERCPSPRGLLKDSSSSLKDSGGLSPQTQSVRGTYVNGFAEISIE